jgi:hypothetical protein
VPCPVSKAVGADDELMTTRGHTTAVPLERDRLWKLLY